MRGIAKCAIAPKLELVAEIAGPFELHAAQQTTTATMTAARAADVAVACHPRTTVDIAPDCLIATTPSGSSVRGSRASAGRAGQLWFLIDQSSEAVGADVMADDIEVDFGATYLVDGNAPLRFRLASPTRRFAWNGIAA